MSNILNHNRDVFQFKISKEDYWDFHLAIDTDSEYYGDGLVERCLSTYIDLSDNECIWFDDIYSKSKYKWENAVNTNTLSLENFGYTSVDNGKTSYEQDKISNKEFFELFTNTNFKAEKDDFRLVLTKVNGNHQLYDYSNDISFWNNKIQSAKLNGGWYQGFFCANDGSEYKILPTDLGSGWSLEFEINKEDFDHKQQILNDVYPENKGIFFYIGTRSENKWWLKYLTNHNFEWCKKSGFYDEYAETDYTETNGLNDSYFKELVELDEHSEYFPDNYLETEQEESDEQPFDKEYMKSSKCQDCEQCGKIYVKDDYYEKEMNLDENMNLQTKNGYDISQPNIKEIKTDNKFVIFDRTKEGQKANTWDEANTEVILNYVEKPNIGNYFELFHHGCGGYDIKKIKELINVKNKEYNVLKDIYRNAFALQIKDNGTVGYKYLIRDCDSTEENYKIESEFTKDSLIKEGEWYTINVKIIPFRHRDKSLYACFSNNTTDEKMKIMIYINGKLVLVSKDLPIFNFKRLEDLDEKQEGVPFNISLGGGTQGLAEVVYLNYMKLPEYVLPLEKEFGGSFIGWLKSFKFYTCPLNYCEVVKNYNFSNLL